MKYWLFSDKRVAEYTLHKAVEGLRKYLVSNKELRYDKPNSLLPQSSIELTKSFNMNGDTVGQWIEKNNITCDLLCDKEEPITRTEWYTKYSEWVKEYYKENDTITNEYEVSKLIVKKTTFYKSVASMFNLYPTDIPTKIDGKVYRLFKRL